MRNAKEVLTDFKYAESLASSFKKYDKVTKVSSNAGGNDCDKFSKKILVQVGFDMYMGSYGSSSVYSCSPNKSKLLDKTVSEYLTDNFNEVMLYSENKIKNGLKKDIKAIEDEILKNNEILEDIKRV